MVDGSRFSGRLCLVAVKIFFGLKILFWDLVTILLVQEEVEELGFLAVVAAELLPD
jgi:hypothetical protein